MFAAWRSGATAQQPQPAPAPAPPQPLLSHPAQNAFLSLLARNIQETTPASALESSSADGIQQGSVTSSSTLATGATAPQPASIQGTPPTRPNGVTSTGSSSQQSTAYGTPSAYSAIASALAQHAAARANAGGAHKDGYMVHSPGSQGKTDSRVPGSSRPATQLDPTAAAGILTKATHFSLVFSTERDGFNVEKFHAAMDAKGPGPTLVLYRDEGTQELVAGFTTCGWGGAGNGGEGAGVYCKDPHAFLGRLYLERPGHVQVQYWPVRRDASAYAVFNHPNLGPTFGQGPDLALMSTLNPGLRVGQWITYAHPTEPPLFQAPALRVPSTTYSPPTPPARTSAAGGGGDREAANAHPGATTSAGGALSTATSSQQQASYTGSSYLAPVAAVARQAAPHTMERRPMAMGTGTPTASHPVSTSGAEATGAHHHRTSGRYSSSTPTVRRSLFGAFSRAPSTSQVALADAATQPVVPGSHPHEHLPAAIEVYAVTFDTSLLPPADISSVPSTVNREGTRMATATDRPQPTPHTAATTAAPAPTGRSSIAGPLGQGTAPRHHPGITSPERMRRPPLQPTTPLATPGTVMVPSPGTAASSTGSTLHLPAGSGRLSTSRARPASPVAYRGVISGASARSETPGHSERRLPPDQAAITEAAAAEAAEQGTRVSIEVQGRRLAVLPSPTRTSFTSHRPGSPVAHPQRTQLSGTAPQAGIRGGRAPGTPPRTPPQRQGSFLLPGHPGMSPSLHHPIAHDTGPGSAPAPLAGPRSSGGHATSAAVTATTAEPLARGHSERRISAAFASPARVSLETLVTKRQLECGEWQAGAYSMGPATALQHNQQQQTPAGAPLALLEPLPTYPTVLRGRPISEPGGRRGRSASPATGHAHGTATLTTSALAAPATAPASPASTGVIGPSSPQPSWATKSVTSPGRGHASMGSPPQAPWTWKGLVPYPAGTTPPGPRRSTGGLGPMTAAAAASGSASTTSPSSFGYTSWDTLPEPLPPVLPVEYVARYTGTGTTQYGSPYAVQHPFQYNRYPVSRSPGRASLGVLPATMIQLAPVAEEGTSNGNGATTAGGAGLASAVPYPARASLQVAGHSELFTAVLPSPNVPTGGSIAGSFTAGGSRAGRPPAALAAFASTRTGPVDPLYSSPPRPPRSSLQAPPPVQPKPRSSALKSFFKSLLRGTPSKSTPTKDYGPSQPYSPSFSSSSRPSSVSRSIPVYVDPDSYDATAYAHSGPSFDDGRIGAGGSVGPLPPAARAAMEANSYTSGTAAAEASPPRHSWAAGSTPAEAPAGPTHAIYSPGEGAVGDASGNSSGATSGGASRSSVWDSQRSPPIPGTLRATYLHRNPTPAVQALHPPVLDTDQQQGAVSTQPGSRQVAAPTVAVPAPVEQAPADEIQPDIRQHSPPPIYVPPHHPAVAAGDAGSAATGTGTPAAEEGGHAQVPNALPRGGASQPAPGRSPAPDARPVPASPNGGTPTSNPTPTTPRAAKASTTVSPFAMEGSESAVTLHHTPVSYTGSPSAPGSPSPPAPVLASIACHLRASSAHPSTSASAPSLVTGSSSTPSPNTIAPWPPHPGQTAQQVHPSPRGVALSTTAAGHASAHHSAGSAPGDFAKEPPHLAATTSPRQPPRQGNTGTSAPATGATGAGGGGMTGNSDGGNTTSGPTGDTIAEPDFYHVYSVSAVPAAGRGARHTVPPGTLIGDGVANEGIASLPEVNAYGQHAADAAAQHEGSTVPSTAHAPAGVVQEGGEGIGAPGPSDALPTYASGLWPIADNQSAAATAGSMCTPQLSTAPSEQGSTATPLGSMMAEPSGMAGAERVRGERDLHGYEKSEDEEFYDARSSATSASFVSTPGTPAGRNSSFGSLPATTARHVSTHSSSSSALFFDAVSRRSSNVGSSAQLSPYITPQNSGVGTRC